MITHEVREAIRNKKQDLNAIILAHNYQLPEIHAVADVIGDSLELALAARDTVADVLIVCGVSFMAETAKILNPKKRVFIPVTDAGCPLADYLTPELIKEQQQKYPEAAVVVYVNSTAPCKAAADIVCTSGNAVQIVKSLKNNQILFGPDSNLAGYVREQVQGKEIIAIPKDGHCYVHQSFTPDDIIRARNIGGIIIAHPECPREIREGADLVASTGRMIGIIREQENKVWHIFTEEGMVRRLQTLFPEITFYHPTGAVCRDMRVTTIEELTGCLTDLRGEIIIPDDIMQDARRSLDRMMNIS